MRYELLYHYLRNSIKRGDLNIVFLWCHSCREELETSLRLSWDQSERYEPHKRTYYCMPNVSSLSDSLLLNIQLRLYIRSLHKWDQWEPIKNEIIYCIKQCLLVHATQVAFTRLPDDQEHWADTIGFLATCFIEDFSSNFTLKTIQINKHSITEIMTLSLHKIINYTAHKLHRVK